ncbi:MAG: zinc ribbon domain-containing protein [Firmicutes bacterium]|nr:zinc ribbon domain-containing protein [Bacillota bacterium]
MFCKECGKDQEAGKFCGGCGASFESFGMEVPALSEGFVVDEFAQEKPIKETVSVEWIGGNPTQDKVAPKQMSRSAKWAVGVIAFLVVVLLAGGVVTLYRDIFKSVGVWRDVYAVSSTETRVRISDSINMDNLWDYEPYVSRRDVADLGNQQWVIEDLFGVTVDVRALTKKQRDALRQTDKKYVCFYTISVNAESAESRKYYFAKLDFYSQVAIKATGYSKQLGIQLYSVRVSYWDKKNSANNFVQVASTNVTEYVEFATAI